MTSFPEMLIKKHINFLCFFFYFKQMFLKPCFKGPFGLSNILHSLASFAASETQSSSISTMILNFHGKNEKITLAPFESLEKKTTKIERS